jgi:hypothetical protein
MRGELGHLQGGKEWGVGLARIPPGRQAALGVGIDYRDRTCADALGFDGQMRRERCLS